MRNIILGLYFLNPSSVLGFITHQSLFYSVNQNNNYRCTTSSLRIRCPSSSGFLRDYDSFSLSSQSNDDEKESESQRLKAKAEELRQQIRKLEEQVNSQRKTIIQRSENNKQQDDKKDEQPKGRSLKNKKILVVGANGRLGSMVVRYLLRNHPELSEVVAAVHYVGTSSTRGYGRLSYEVGAEDGVGKIGPIWNADERDATFMYSNDMKSYNLQKLRVVPTELLDPVQCKAVTEGVDSVIWCATDFNGNIPRSISSLDSALLFRAVADFTKGRVEIEGLINILGALYQSKLNQSRMKRVSGDSPPSSYAYLDSPNDPISFVLISSTPSAFGDYETPYGEFNALKRQGEQILLKDYPSLTSCVLQMSKFEDNFVQESLEIQSGREDGSTDDFTKTKRRINRRDAAKAAAQTLIDDTLVGKVTQIWTAVS